MRYTENEILPRKTIGRRERNPRMTRISLANQVIAIARNGYRKKVAHPAGKLVTFSIGGTIKTVMTNTTIEMNGDFNIRSQLLIAISLFVFEKSAQHKPATKAK